MKQIPRTSRDAGFTFIEVIVTVFIVSIAAIAMLQGVVYARSMIRSIRLETRALEELEKYVEEYRAVISATGESNRRYMAAPNQPLRVALTDADETENVLYGYIDRDNVEKRFLGNQYKHTPYYELKAWIEWDENPDDGRNVDRRLELDVDLFEFP